MHHVLVTGVNGFVGNHLVRTLTGAGCETSGLTYGGDVVPDIDALLKTSTVCDLTDADQVKEIDFSPYHTIINLAGLANVGQSFDNPELYMTVNVLVLENLCEWLVQQHLSPRIIAVSTGAVYESHQPMPLTETSKAVENGSPYAKSKLAMEKVAERYRNKGLGCIVVRPFNHIGPGQKAGFIVPDLYQKLTSAVRSNKPVIVGNLKTRRDYTDVRDVVQAYTSLALAEPGKLRSSVYNICSGVSRSGEELLAELKKHVPGSEKLQIEVDQKLIRPDDPEELVGSNKLISKDTGWKPKIPLGQTIADSIKAQAT